LILKSLLFRIGLDVFDVDIKLTLAISNGIAALSAATTYFREKMVDLKIALPLIISS
jgi:uncharacterized membrane protein YfcA